MTLEKLISTLKGNPYWNGKVFICYSQDRIRRLKSEGLNPADGEIFTPEELDKDTLNSSVGTNQWWIEDGDLCVDFYRNW